MNKLNFIDVREANITYDAIAVKNQQLQKELNKAIDEIIELKEKLNERNGQSAA
tara:strand:+ start:1779 stop:1940 length:162 start_codon:yes stop_codon:yes gene_type:complete